MFSLELLSSFQAGALCPFCSVWLTHLHAYVQTYQTTLEESVSIGLILSEVLLGCASFEEWSWLIASFLMKSPNLFAHSCKTLKGEKREESNKKIYLRGGGDKAVNVMQSLKVFFFFFLLSSLATLCHTPTQRHKLSSPFDYPHQDLHICFDKRVLSGQGG